MSADTGISTTSIDTSAPTLGAFLRRMRDRAVPATPSRVARRRAVGMRREEVSTAAGISVTWYTWLEQGRAVRVSRTTLLAIARALRLNAAEREHLLRLAAAAGAGPEATSITGTASPSLRRVVDGFTPHPAYAVNGRWDVLHENAAAASIFGSFTSVPGQTDNVLTRLFLDPAWRALFDQWETVTTSAVAQFRAATAPWTSDERWRGFVERLAAESDAFAAMWARHDLADAISWEKTLRHPTRGTLRFLYTSVSIESEPSDVRVIVYTAAGEPCERISAQ